VILAAQCRRRIGRCQQARHREQTRRCARRICQRERNISHCKRSSCHCKRNVYHRERNICHCKRNVYHRARNICHCERSEAISRRVHKSLDCFAALAMMRAGWAPTFEVPAPATRSNR